MLPVDMIVKVQVPFSSGDIPAALVYSRDRSWIATFDRAELPAAVWAAAVRGHGKAYFHTKETDTELTFGEQAEAQDW